MGDCDLVLVVMVLTKPYSGGTIELLDLRMGHKARRDFEQKSNLLAIALSIQTTPVRMNRYFIIGVTGTGNVTTRTLFPMRLTSLNVSKPRALLCIARAFGIAAP